MKPFQDTTPLAGVTTLSDVFRWRSSLIQWHARLASHFARPEPFQRTLRFVQGILREAPRKNGWQLAEQARETTPSGMQRLLSQAVWNEDGVRDEIRTFVLAYLGSSHLSGAIDETSFPKQGKPSAGVSRQYGGAIGEVRNCQVGVFLSLVSPAGHTLIDRAWSVPQEWTDDPARCRRAHIPPTRPFRTKPQLAMLLLERLERAHLSLDWVTADTVYGGNPDLRDWLERRRQPDVMAVPSTEPVVLELPEIGVRRLEVREVVPLLAPSAWSRLSLSQGRKGPRFFDWACVPVWRQGRDDGWHSLLIRRPADPTDHLAYDLVLADPSTSLSTKVTALGGRWRIEEDFENSKDLGLDQYEVRSFTGWVRHITLVMLALAFLTSVTIAARTQPLAPVGAQTSPVGDLSPRALWPLSVPEARRLLARLLFPPPTSTPLVFQWSAWRRWHQRTASFFHLRQRLKAGEDPRPSARSFPGSPGSLPCTPREPRLTRSLAFFLKGDFIMTLLPFLDGCSLFGIDPKTLRFWLKAANLSCLPHPTDARLKCLTRSQLHHLADLHGRSLPASLLGEEGESASCAQTTFALVNPHGPSTEMPVPDADLRSQLSVLQARLATLEAQVTELALALMHERAAPTSRRAMPPLSPPPASAIRATPLAPHPNSPLPGEATPPPVRHRSPSRALPLIEYRTDGTYLVLSPTDGVLAFAPDSAEWFDWLATITAFAFVGAHGRFSARRTSLHRQFTRCWRAYRVVHGHQSWFSVGLTDHLTIARLEQVAVTVQTRLAAL